MKYRVLCQPTMQDNMEEPIVELKNCLKLKTLVGHFNVLSKLDPRI